MLSISASNGLPSYFLQSTLQQKERKIESRATKGLSVGPRKHQEHIKEDVEDTGVLLTSLHLDNETNQQQQTRHIHGEPREDESLAEVHSLLERGHLDMAVHALSRDSDMVPSAQLFWLLLKACRTRASLPRVKLLHIHIALCGFDVTRFLGESLAIAFAQCLCLSDAIPVFHRLPHRTASSWSAIISAYHELGMYADAIALYKLMLADDVEPTKYIFVSVIQSCAKLPDLQQGKYMHDQAVKYSCASELFVAACLVDMYVSCGSMSQAQIVFDRLCQRDVVTWNVMLSAYLDHDQADKVLQLYRRMQNDNVVPTERTLMFCLQACCRSAEDKSGLQHQQLATNTLLDMARSLHCESVCYGFDLDSFLSSTLINVYGSLGCILEAQFVFDVMSKHDTVSITAMLSAYVEQGQESKALELYGKIQEPEVSPDEGMFAITLRACCTLVESNHGVSDMGRLLHADAVMRGFDLHIFVGNSLVNMYGKCGSSSDAEYVFSQLQEQSSVSWNALMSAYIQEGNGEKALLVYKLMRDNLVHPNEQTFVIALQACCLVADQEETVLVEGRLKKVISEEIGQMLHSDIRMNGLHHNVFIGSSLINLYGKCGNVAYAYLAFEDLPQRDTVSWTGMLACHLDEGEDVRCLQLYKLMHEMGVSPNAQTFVVVLKACSQLAENEEHSISEDHLVNPMISEIGQALHIDVRRNGFQSNVFVCSALVTMYGKCGNMGEAEELFESWNFMDVVAWNAMLSLYEQQGNTERAVQTYCKMQEEGVAMDDVSFALILSACGKSGCLESCRHIHFSMFSGGYDLDSGLANALIHAYGCCSSMPDAQEIFNRLPNADISTWNALVCGYAKDGNYPECLHHFEKMVGAGVEPNEATFISLLSVCSHAGLLDESLELLESMSRDYGLAPSMEHYTSVLDVLGRAGDFMKIQDLLLRMPEKPDLTMSLRLLGACQKHGKVDLAKRLFELIMELQPQQDAAYILMSNIYVVAGLPELAQEVDLLRREKIEKNMEAIDKELYTTT